VLPQITINPPGLVIEDFNMTFEVYRKKLGRVGFTVAAQAITQDPDTVPDYVRQTGRWALGLWQTVRRHRLRPDLLSLVLVLLLGELLTASLLFVLLPVAALLLVAARIPAVVQLPPLAAAAGLVAAHVSLPVIALGVLAPDLLLSCLVAAVERRAGYLLFAPLFVLLRVVDAGIALYSLPRAWLERSNGRWSSPARRAAGVALDDLTGAVEPDDGPTEIAI
jgi:poly-beta-1,6-N-acetyl-D-glucosamine synthase